MRRAFGNHVCAEARTAQVDRPVIDLASDDDDDSGDDLIDLTIDGNDDDDLVDLTIDDLE
jgi:hypothetical protein